MPARLRTPKSPELPGFSQDSAADPDQFGQGEIGARNAQAWNATPAAWTPQTKWWEPLLPLAAVTGAGALAGAFGGLGGGIAPQIAQAAEIPAAASSAGMPLSQAAMGVGPLSFGTAAPTAAGAGSAAAGGAAAGAAGAAASSMNPYLALLLQGGLSLGGSLLGGDDDEQQRRTSFSGNQGTDPRANLANLIALLQGSTRSMASLAKQPVSLRGAVMPKLSSPLASRFAQDPALADPSLLETPNMPEFDPYPLLTAQQAAGRGQVIPRNPAVPPQPGGPINEGENTEGRSRIPVSKRKPKGGA